MEGFTASEAYAQARHDCAMANEAVGWFERTFGPLSDKQKDEVYGLVLGMRYDAHVRSGQLEKVTVR